jgi:hypothetical protein
MKSKISISPWINPNSKAAYHPDFTPIELWTKAAYNKESANVKLVYWVNKVLLIKNKLEIGMKRFSYGLK